MFVPAPNACGCLLVAAQPLDNVMTVDSGLYQILESTLGIMGDNHTYLKVGVAPDSEYIRVVMVSSIPNQVVVDRGIDGTLPRGHAANSYIEYILAAESVRDIVGEATVTGITIDAVSPIHVDNALPNKYTISIDPLKLSSNNKTILATGEYPNIDLAVNPINGCCS